MKRSQHLLLVFLFPLTLLAQSDFSFVPHSHWTNYAALAVGENAIAAAGFSEQCDRPTVTLLDRATGEELWTASGPVGSAYGTYTSVDFADDGTVWAAGWVYQDPDVDIETRVILTHFGLDGMWIIHWESTDDEADQSLPGVEVLPDGRILWSEDGHLNIRTSDGNIGDALVNINITPLFTDALTSTRFAYTDGSTLQIRDEDSQLPMFIYYSVDPITGLIANEDEVYWAEGSSLFRYVVSSQTFTDFSTDATEPLRLARKGEEVLIYEVALNESRTWVFSPDENTLSEGPTWQMPAQRLLQLEWSEDEYYQLGTDLYEPPGEFVFFPYYHGFVQRTADLSLVPAADIGVVGINAQIDSASIGIYDTYWYRGNVYWSGQVEIQNFSAIPVVDSFLLISPADDGIFCVEGRYYEVIPFAIAPQGTSVVDFEYNTFDYAELNAQGNFVIEKELCFYTAAPDHRIDLNAANNMHCETFTIVDTDEVPEPTSEFKVFPNPARNGLTIELPGAYLEHVQVFDMLGRSLQAQSIEQANTYQMDLQGLPAGTYWIKLETDQGVFQQRVLVKQ